jgi:glutaconate CoA-transferase subunit B
MNAKSVFVIMRQSPRSFVERLDFRTSLGTRVQVVVTDLGIFHLDEGEMRLDSLHPGVTLEQVRTAMGWQPRVADHLAETPAPTDAELRMIREELDPNGVYTT